MEEEFAHFSHEKFSVYLLEGLECEEINEYCKKQKHCEEYRIPTVHELD